MRHLTQLLILLSTFLVALPATALSDSTYHYEAIPGKLLGIWRPSFTEQDFVRFHDRYGFSGVFIAPDIQMYSQAMQAGFNPANMMTSVFIPPTSVDLINVGGYYIDEAMEHNCTGQPSGFRIYSPQELSDIRAYITANRPGSKFILSGYKRCSHNWIASLYADVFMYSSYMNWDDLGIRICFPNLGWGDSQESPWLPGSADQRSSWTSMRNTYGAKFSMSWIRGSGDEYPQLFTHANTLGLVGLWVFAPEPLDTNSLELLCNAAWQNGWLNKVLDPPLPVQISSFTALSVPPRGVLLEWTTISEMHNFGFEVQRRPASELQFSTLPNSFVPGHGTTLEPQHYSFRDTAVAQGSWHYRLKQIDFDGTVHFTDHVTVSVLTVVHEEAEVPRAFDLGQNFPNPFNPSTTFSFDIPVAAFVQVKVFDMLGREVAILASKETTPGRYSVVWDATGMATGVYVYRLHADGYVASRKMLLCR
jgi:hypothetical protein